jgi:superfamily I DNA/RNA helicase
MSLKPKVALSQEFLLNLANLPSAIHSKVLKWAIRFQSDPTAAGINYEKINTARDPNLRSVRIDQDWRGIVFKPAQGDVYVLLHVGHHDDAYKWAENRKLAINPVTGAMQLVILQDVVEAIPAPAPQSATLAAVSSPGMFDPWNDRDLVSLGVPEDLLPRVRTLRSEADLDTLQPSLPIEAYEGLFLVAAGDTVDQVLRARETRVDRPIDTTDFSESLETPESQARFVIVDGEDELTAIMNAPLAQWRVFLHPTQRALATGDRSGPVRVLGGAGTGKTVLAMHRAKWLAENRTPEGKKVLFTTFTRNLAFDIEENLNSFCPQSTMMKIEVRNLDAWVHGFLRAQKYEHTIVYNRQKDASDAWQRALAVKDPTIGLPDSFYEEELDQVILAQGITSRDDYRVARRAGRGVVLTRGKRDTIWPVFEEYRAQLASRKLKEVDDAYRDAAALLAKGGGRNKPEYSAIVVDETQDFGPQALRLLRAMIPAGANDLFFVGDGHQRIYTRNRAAMSRCGIEIRGRSRKLYLNYRTTEEIRRRAVSLLEGCEIDDLDEGRDENRRYKSLSHGTPPLVVNEPTLEAAMTRTFGVVKEWDAAGSPERTTCVVAATRAIRDNCEQVFRGKGMTTHVVEANKKDALDASAVRFSTMHRAKGLEFDQVLVVAPKEFLGLPAETLNERRLLYVSLTRAKRAAALVTYGDPTESTINGGLRLTGVDPGSQDDRMSHRRLVCLIDGGGKLAIWGRDGNARNIDAVREAGFPCLVSGVWRDPEPWAVKYGHTHWLEESGVLTVTNDRR